MEKNSSTIISCEDISKSYGTGENKTQVLSSISFSVQAGEFVAIVGPSGSGKSTLMNILGALDTPSEGTYILDGRNITSLNEDELATIRNTKIGFVFQSFNLMARATVERNVRLPLIYSSVIKEEDRNRKVHEAIVAAGLDLSKIHNKPSQLSGGQMQRVAIARALINEPAIILADEPTGNLDQATGKIVIATFQNLNRQGRTIILITHDMNVALNASRIIRIQDGKLISDQMNTIKTNVSYAK